VLCAALISGLLGATPAAESLNPYLAPAIQQIRDFDEAGALATLEKARKWPQNTPRDLAQVYFYTGLAHGALAHEDEAVRCFKNALELDPSVSLPRDASPRIKEWWKRAGGTLEEPPPPPSLVPNAQPQVVFVQPPPRSRALAWTGGAAAGAGFIAVVVGSVLDGAGWAQYQGALGPWSTAADQGHAVSQYNAAQRTTQAGNTVIAVGAPVLAIGVGLLFWGLHGS
jgi:hypothetical protein